MLATMSVFVCLSVTEVHCDRGAFREEERGHLALCWPLLGPLVYISKPDLQNAPTETGDSLLLCICVR